MEEREQCTETRIVYGIKAIMDIADEILLTCKSNYDVYCDKNGPSFMITVSPYNEVYSKLKKNNVKIRLITEITTKNIKNCKEIIDKLEAEVKHLEGIKGNFAISDDNIYIATSSLEENKPIPDMIYSTVKGVVEQNRYLFETLWKKSISAEQRITEIEQGLLPVETRVLDNSREIYTHILDITEKSHNGLSNCSTVGGFQMIYDEEHLFQTYSHLVVRYKEGKVKGGVRWVTHIEDKREQIDLIKIFLTLGIEIRHVNNLPPMSFALSDKQFQGTIEKMEPGKMFENVLYSTEPLYIKHFQSIFEELWRNGIEALQRIDQIEKGISSETTKVIENPSRSKELLLRLLQNAQEEIMIVFPSFKTVRRQFGFGVSDLLKQKSQENLRIRILSPMSEPVKELLLLVYAKENDQNIENLFVREIVKQQDINSTILMVDRKFLLTMELKDDSKETFEESTGLSTYSTSKPTLLSYTSIFESLWTQTEMSDNLRLANEKLEIHDNLQNDFINMAAHELRTPSQAISGYAELALLDYDIKDKEKNIRYLETISRNAERLSRLTVNILSVARIESKTLKLNKEFFNLEELISTSVEDFNIKLSKLQHKDIGVIFEKNMKKNVPIKQDHSTSSSRDRPYMDSLVEADSEKIEQVLVNLLDNAIKFSKGKIFIKITEDNLLFVVEVKDSGPGIDPEILPNLFSKFVSKSDIGTGLGLFICKNIIETHGGSIWAQNNNNKNEKGATFSFSLSK
ncbi:MAG: hypothetical protein H0W19_07715 [Nitrosopumilus sp.]|nr:hypothetical protein [Nitrosopumilus sp.]